MMSTNIERVSPVAGVHLQSEAGAQSFQPETTVKSTDTLAAPVIADIGAGLQRGTPSYLSSAALGVLGLGLATPGNSEAVLLQLKIISNRLAQDNEALKEITASNGKRNALSQMLAAFSKISSVAEDINSLQQQLTSIKHDKSALQAELSALGTQQAMLEQNIILFSGDPTKTEELAMAQADLADVGTQMAVVSSQISTVNGQIGQLQSELDAKQQLQSSIQNLGGAVFLSVLRLAPEAEADEDANAMADAVIEESLRTIYDDLFDLNEVSLRDNSVKELLGEIALENEQIRMARISAMMSALVATFAEVVIEEQGERQVERAARPNHEIARAQLAV